MTATDGCQCDGTGPSGPVTVSCGQSACGSDYYTYLCSESGWSWTGARCTDADAGDSGACGCDGSGPGGIPVHSACGESACGSDQYTYLCSASGWQWTGQPCSTCECQGTEPGNIPITIACGHSACGTDLQTYTCLANGAWSAPQGACGPDAGSGCQCQGTGPGNVPVTASCGQSACGSDLQTYTCLANASWSSPQGPCGPDGGTDGTCECHGIGPGGVPVTATCGGEACGSDYSMYQCLNQAWVWTGTGCPDAGAGGSGGAGGAGGTGGSTPPCECHGTGPGGGPVTALCGENACGSDYYLYACTPTGWQGANQPCATAVVNLTADPVGRVVDVTVPDTASVTAPWDRFRFDIDIAQPLARDSGGFVADLDQDGVADLLLPDSNGRLQLFPGLAGQPRLFGDGRYLRRWTTSAADDPFYFGDFSGVWVTGDMADFDGDGVKELVIGDRIYGNVGTPSAPVLKQQYQLAGSNWWDPAASVGDLNGDGKPDVVVTRSYSGGITVYWNTSSPGAFSFTSQTLLAAAGSSQFVTVADIDGDGKLDLVSPTGIYLNTGTPTAPVFDFNTATAWNKSGGPSWMATSDQPGHVFMRDVDGDGLLDAYVCNIGATVWQALYYKNTGTAANHQLTYQGPVVARSVAADVAYRSKTAPDFSPYRVFVANGDIDGNGLVEVVLSQSKGSFGRAALAWQFSDAATGGSSRFAYPDLYTYPAHSKIDADCGAGPFGTVDALCRPPNLLGAWSDFTGDGLPDALHIDQFMDVDNLYTSSRVGTMPFTLSSDVALKSSDAVQAVGWGVALVDVDLDGVKDIVGGTADGKLMYYRNTGGTGAIALAPGVLLTSASAVAIDVGDASWPAAFDLDGDGDMDLVVGDQDGNLHRILCASPGAANGYADDGLLATVDQTPFNLSHVVGGGNLAPSLTALDINHDGLQDLVMGDNEGRAWVLRNTGTSTAPVFVVEPLLLSRTNAAYLEIVDPHTLRAYFALPIVTGQTHMGIHGLPTAGGGTLTLSIPIGTP